MQLNEDKFTIQNLKQLLKETFDFDYEKHKGEIELQQFTIVEWHKSDILKEHLLACNNKDKLYLRYRPLNARGRYFSKEKIIAIFFSKAEIGQLLECRGKSLDKLIVLYIKTVFHELNHYYQEKFRYKPNRDTNISLNAFAYDMATFIQHFNPGHYKKHHNEYLNEIDSNLYGVSRAYEFLEKKGLLTEKRKNILEELENRYLFELNNHDMHTFFHEIHGIVKSNYQIRIHNYWFLSLFYKWTGKFKSIDEILDSAYEWDLDKQILDCFFSSKDFLDNLDFNSLSL